MNTNEDDVLRHRLQDTKPAVKERILLGENKEDLLHWKDMPKHLQFNPYIFTGYRPLLSIWGCLSSLFYLHNETINILSHGNILSNFFFILHYLFLQQKYYCTVNDGLLAFRFIQFLLMQ